MGHGLSKLDYAHGCRNPQPYIVHSLVLESPECSEQNVFKDRKMSGHGGTHL